MSDKPPITAEQFLTTDHLGDDNRLEGAELRKVFWVVRGREKELARKEKFWSATNETLARAYEILERQSAELKVAREELMALNRDLEQRVSDQVQEIMRRTGEAELLHVHLRAKVKARSRELTEALRELSEGRGGSCDLAPGEVFGDRVKIVAVLGEGGMGTVYKAEDLHTKQPVAVKLIHPEVASGSTALRRFITEAAASSAILHPGVVRTLHIDVTPDGRIYQIMDYIDGVALSTYCRKRPLAPALCARIGASMASAIGAAHAVGVVHRDLKPGNMLLCSQAPGLRILDFGISKLVSESDDGVALTQSHQLIGTPSYMSPEQIVDPGTVTPASDVYSLGVILYEMVTGRLPFSSANLWALCAAHISEVPIDARSIVDDIPEALASLIERCLSKAPSVRPTAIELKQALESIADSLGADTAEHYADVLRYPSGAPSADTVDILHAKS